MHMEKVIKSYITDIDAREFKEFDDELDVDVKVEKKDSIILLLILVKQILLVISIRFVIYVNKDILCQVSFRLHIYFMCRQD